jgi:hypothetical protein
MCKGVEPITQELSSDNPYAFASSNSAASDQNTQEKRKLVGTLTSIKSFFRRNVFRQNM